MHIPFNPDPNGTVNINVGAASAAVQVYPEAGPINIQVTNDGTATVWVAFGDSTITTALTTGLPIRAGETRTFNFVNRNGNAALNVAAIAVGATGKVYFTPGRGGF